MSANNQIVLIGRVGNDPAEDMRNTTTGSRVGEVRLAVNRPGKDQEGNTQTDWINCQFWNKQAELIAQYVSKGDLISISGSLRIDKWQKDGEWKSKTFIHGENFQMLESRQAKEERRSGGGYEAQERKTIVNEHFPKAQAAPIVQNDEFALDDDELPPF